MNWTDRFWTAYGVVINTSIDLTVSTLNSVGSIACIVGGALGTASYFVNETVNVSYYGAAQFSSEIMVSLSLIEANYTYSQTIPFNHGAELNNELIGYTFDQLIKPANLWTASMILSFSGMALRALGANLNQWQLGRREQEYYKMKSAIPVGTPGWDEYAFTNAASIAGSISYVVLSSAIVEALINFTKLPGSAQSITYPSHSALYTSGPHYSGPIKPEVFVLDYKIDRNATFVIPGLDVLMHLEGTIDAVAQANVTYGGGVFFKSHSQASSPVIFPALLAGSAIGLVAQQFFSRKNKEREINRVLEAERSEFYLPINTLP